jgi:hypothetical protein
VVAADRGSLALEASGTVHTEPRLEPGLAVAFGVTKGDTPELVTSQLTQLGVDRILAVTMARSVARWAGDRAAHARERLERVAREAAARQLLARFVPVAVAYHSPQMDPLREEFLAAVGELEPQEACIQVVSSVTGAHVEGRELDAGYWWRNVRDMVRFGDAALAMIDDGATSFVELGPHPVLVRALRDDVQPRYASVPDAPAGGVLLLARGAECPAAFRGRQGFLGARVVDGVLVAHWSSPLMYQRAGGGVPGGALYVRDAVS